MEHVEGKTAFITGGASGIGLGIAKAFARNNMKVVIADSRRDALDDAMSWFTEHGGEVHPIQLDITDRDAYIRAADETEALYGNIHVLVNNAGVASGGRLEDITFKDWDFSIGVNITGTTNGLVIMLPRILRHGEGGHIVSTASTAGLMAVNGCIIYNTTKYAICGMMETLAADLDGTNVGASVLIPGPTTTNLGQSTFANRPAHLQNDNPPPPPSPPPLDEDGKPRKMPMFDTSLFMDPVETGERVLRGIKRNDIWIHTHPEFRNGYAARHDALIRSIPDEPPFKERADLIAKFGTLMYNPVYERQTTPGPPDW